MGLVGIKGMVGKNNIRIKSCHRNINGSYHVGSKGNILRGEVQNLNILDAQNMKGIQTFLNSQFIAALHFSFFIGIAGLAHNQNFHRMTIFNRFGQGAATGNFNVIQMGANC